MDGALTVPGDIKSSGNINIDINLTDSTLRRWSFGEDGSLTIPGYVTLPNNSELRPSTATYDAGLMEWENVRGGEIQNAVDNNIVTAEGWPMVNWHPTGPTAQGYLDFILNAWTIQQAYPASGPLVITPAMSSNLYQVMRSALTKIRDNYNLYSRGVSISSGYAKSWNFSEAGDITFPDGTKQSTAPAITISADDSTQRTIYLGEESIKFIGAGGITTSSDAEGNITITGTVGSTDWNDITNKPDLAGTYQFSVAADDSTQRVISTDELVKFIGAGTVTTSSDTEGNITITGTSGIPSQTGNTGKYLTTDGTTASWATVAGGGGGGSTLVNGAFEASLGATGNLTIPGDILSENEINIDLNLSDSTLRRWTFGQDGELSVPGNINTTATTFTLVNTTATTVSFAGAATALTIANGLTSTTAQAVSIATGSNTGTKTINIGTGGGGATITLGIAASGSTTIASPSIQSGANTVSLFTSTSTSISFATAATTLAIGSTGAGAITTLNAPTVIGSATTQNLYNTVATTVNEFGAATAINVATNAASATTWTLGNPNNTNTLTVAGGTASGTDSISSTVTTGIINVFTGLTTGTLNIATGSSATAINIGGATSTTVVGNGLTVRGPLISTSSAGITAVEFDTEQLTVTGNRIATTVTNANLELECNGTGGVVINNVAAATTASTAASVGYLGLPQNATGSTTLTITDAGKHIYVTSASQTITIPAATSVAYPIGTTITFIAGPSASSTSIAITTDTMYLAGTGTTGTRTLAAYGMATAVKVSGTSSSGVWFINGTGLT
jgi:hypothetical protein